MTSEVNKIIVEGTVSVPKSVLRNADIDRIYRELKYPTRDGQDIFGFQEDVDRFYLPKFWYLKTMGAKYRHLVVNKEPESELKPRLFDGELRPHQRNSEAPYTSTPELIRLLQRHRGVFAEAPCGSGKTVSGIFTSATLGGKTIIIVPSEAVFQQWVEQVRRFDPTASIGFYGGGRKMLQADVVITMLQTLYKHQGDKLVCDLLIVDEAHMIAAEQFQKCVFNVNFKYSLPLTATGDRFDNLDPLFRNALGEVKVSLDTDQMPVDIHLHPFEHSWDKALEYNIDGRNKFGLDLKIAKDDERNIFLLHLLQSMVNKKRRLLVLGKYKDHLTMLAKTLHELTGCPYVMYMGSTSAAARESIMRQLQDPRTVMFATLKKGGVGMDVQHFDCMVPVLPVSDPRQLIGRIQRFLPGKRRPVVIDIVDNLERLEGRAYIRVRKGYLKVETATVINHCPFLRFKYGGRIKEGGS